MNPDEKADQTSKKNDNSQDKSSTEALDEEVNSEVQQQQPSCSKKAETNRILRSFDRLLPRYCDDSKKRKAASNSVEDSSTPAKKPANPSGGGTKKEYSKLRTLVPALTEREDLSKVEIIEETIRYIDALHHQLAARGVSQEPEEQQTQQQPETNPENPSASPLKALLSGESSVSRPRRTGGAAPSGSSNISAGTSSNSTTPNITTTGSSSERSSTGDVKAAVENIQAMFAAYLEHQRNTNSSSDDSNS